MRTSIGMRKTCLFRLYQLMSYFLFARNFNQLPEELCFYLLEQVYQIISAAQLELETETGEKSIKQLRKQYNLAQVKLT